MSLEYRRLFILIEGNDDGRFFEKVIKPRFEKEYDSVQLYRYAKQSSKKNADFIKSILAMKADYIIVGDINKSSCITQKKDSLERKKFKGGRVNKNNIVVVIKEIESWYLAGLDFTDLKKLGIAYPKRKMDTLTKEQFDRLIPDKFISRIDFMQEILKFFRTETATRNNKSFEYFVNKFKI